jgi:hypothetical protein
MSRKWGGKENSPAMTVEMARGARKTEGNKYAWDEPLQDVAFGVDKAWCVKSRWRRKLGLITLREEWWLTPGETTGYLEEFESKEQERSRVTKVTKWHAWTWIVVEVVEHLRRTMAAMTLQGTCEWDTWFLFFGGNGFLPQRHLLYTTCKITTSWTDKIWITTS